MVGTFWLLRATTQLSPHPLCWLRMDLQVPLWGKSVWRWGADLKIPNYLFPGLQWATAAFSVLHQLLSEHLAVLDRVCWVQVTCCWLVSSGCAVCQGTCTKASKSIEAKTSSWCDKQRSWWGPPILSQEVSKLLTQSTLYLCHFSVVVGMSFWNCDSHVTEWLHLTCSVYQAMATNLFPML